MSLLTQGTVISISDDNGTTWTDIGCITSFGIEQPERAEIDVTCLTSSSKEYKFGLRDNGTLSLGINYEPQSAGQKMLEQSYASDEPYSFKIEYTDVPDGGTNGTTKQFKGYTTSISESGELDGIVSEDVSIRITGDIQVTNPA